MSSAPRMFVKGNEALVHGALDAGCRCYFGYPITPQNDIPEMLSAAMPAIGGEFVQAESEVASANMLLGAAGAGIGAFFTPTGLSVADPTAGASSPSALPSPVPADSASAADPAPRAPRPAAALRSGRHGQRGLTIHCPDMDFGPQRGFPRRHGHIDFQVPAF